MKNLTNILVSFLVLCLPFLNSFSQESEEGETPESIIARDLFIRERRVGGPGQTLSFDAYSKAIEHKLRIIDAKDLPDSPFRLVNWVSVNPTGMFYNRTGANYISGRTNSVAFHPTDANIIYIAAAGGGVWKTVNGGVNWTVLTDGLTSIASGDVVVDQSNPNVIYYGTGELNYSLDSHYGDGIFKSTDGGTTWTKIATSATVGTRISQIAIDPTNSNILYAGGNSGIYKSTNAGLNWTNTGGGTNVNCVIIDPTNTQIIFMTSGGTGSNLIRKSTDGGTTWTTLTTGLPASGKGRTQLAMAPSNHLVIYASIAASGTGALLGLYRTVDGGNNWTLQASSPNYLGGQGWYDNVVVVSTTNSNLILAGGIDIYSSTYGGVTLVQKTAWASSSSSNFSHADIHRMTYRGSVLYCCSDGGIYKSTNNGDTWSDLNRTISTLQYQGADYDPTSVIKMYGGTQDNDKETTTNGGADWIQRTTGDGGYTVVDPVNPNYVYGQYVNGSLMRSANNGVSYSSIDPSGSTGGLFYNPYEMAPGDHLTIVYAQADVWKTTNAQTASSGSGWTQIGTTGIVGGSVSAIGISWTTTNKIYIGTSNGRVLVTTDNGTNWTTVTGFSYVSDFICDPANDNICYASCGGTSSNQVFKTSNGGLNWTNITGNLPNIAANSLIFKSTGTRALVVGMDAGVYYTLNEGANWVGINNGLPSVEVYDMKYHEPAGLLMAATHGRGCWTIDLNSVIGIKGYSNEIPRTFTLEQNYPNPFNPTTRFKFGVPKNDKAGLVNLSIYDALGRLVETLVNSQLQAGTYEVQWDASKYTSGIYYYKLSTNDFSETKKMVLIK